MKKNILIIDNYDSFTYNLVFLVEQCMPTAEEASIHLVKNDALDTVNFDNYNHIIISPGPDLPHRAGQLMETLVNIYRSHRILGVCLGHQAIGEFFGGKLAQLEVVCHGLRSEVSICQPSPIFNGVSQQFWAGRYHSWVVAAPLPDCLKPIAYADDTTIMAIQHQTLPIYGVQFHIESIMTPEGKKIMENFLAL